MRGVARLVREKGFERCPDYVSVGEIEDVPLLVEEEEEIEVSCVFLGLSDCIRALSIFLPERRSGSWYDLSLRTVPWSCRAFLGRYGRSLFPRFCLQGVFVLNARGRDRVSPYQWASPFLM